MTKSGKWGLFAIAALAAGHMLYAAPAKADPVGDFYKGKRMKMIIRSSPGGGYDTYARLLAQHIVKHIPGRPNKMLSINMPGGGGIKAANYIATIAPKDGTVLTIVSRGLPMYQVTGGKKFKGDVRKFSWICDLSDSNPLLVTWHTSPTKTIADARKRETIIGATGAGSISVQIPAAYNKLLGTKIKIIYGYKGGGSVNLAMERGEVEGRATNNLASWKSTNPEWIEGKKLNYLMQLGLKRDKELPNVPLLTDLVKGDKEKAQVARFLTLANVVGRPIAVGPGVPADRVAALRKACGDTMSDPDFLKTAGEQRAEIGYQSGKNVQKIIEEIVNAPQSLVDRVKLYMKPRGDAEKRAVKLKVVTSVIVKTNKKGNRIVIKDGGANATVKVHSRRTKIRLNGKKATRKKIKAGMTCEVAYEGDGTEAATLTCKK
jgi:tripartite-type tricarboxylate transporter receptor subunit TctC